MLRNINSVKISPSIIATNLANIGETLKQIDSDVVDLLHMDVMDGHFVPNLTFGAGYIKDLSVHTKIPLDIHLMIENPELTIDQFIALNPWCISIHYESTRFPARLLSKIREAGIVPALAINPATPVESIFDLLGYLDMVLIMSVDPGFFGQSFMESSYNRIEKLRSFADANGFEDLLLQVDGGVGVKNIKFLKESGVDVFVAGSAAFKDGNINKNVKELKKVAVMQKI